MPKKKGLTLEQHKCMGSRLKHIEHMLMYIYGETAVAYGKTKSPSKEFYKLRKDIESIRHKMEDQMYKDHQHIWNLAPNGDNTLNYYLGEQIDTGYGTPHPGRYHLLPDDPRLQMVPGQNLEPQPPT